MRTRPPSRVKMRTCGSFEEKGCARLNQLLTLLSSAPTATVTPSGDMETQEAGKVSGTVAETLPASSTTIAFAVIATAVAGLRGLTARALGVAPSGDTWSEYTKPPAVTAEQDKIKTKKCLSFAKKRPT